MATAKVLVTGATGKTGSHVVLQLLALGYMVRAFVHRFDRRSEMLQKAGAEVVHGSLEDIGDLRKSMIGAQRAYFCPPLEYGTLRRATLFAAAAEEAKLEMIVVLSQWLTDPLHAAIHSREKWLTGKVFEWMPSVGIVTVNPGFFADNYLLAMEPMAQFGLMAMPLGEGLNAPPSNEDIASVIVGALVSPAKHIGKTYRPTGPELLAPGEIASVIGRVLGRRVEYKNAPMKLFLKVARSLRIPDFVIEELYWYLQDYQRNSFAVSAPTDVVREVGGKSPDRFEEIVRRCVTTSPVVHRTMAARTNAVWNLLKGLLTPSPEPLEIADRLQIPRVANARLAADSIDWYNSHANVAVANSAGVFGRAT